MANFVATLSKLISLVDYSFQEICVKSNLALIIYLRAVFTIEDILSVLAFPQITNVDEVIMRNFLSF